MSLTVRPANAGDIEFIADISAESLYESWSAGSLHEIFENAAYTVLVCERADHITADHMIAGYIILFTAADECNLLSLGVSAETRRRGIGRALTEIAAQHARKRGCCAIYLEVRESNIPAVKLYESCGFEPCGMRPGFYQNPDEDAKLYKLPIIE